MTPLQLRANHLRKEVMAMVAHARRGHIASAFSLIEIMAILYDDIMRYDPANPSDPNRDRFILSKGHGCLALYAILADKGFFPRERYAEFCAPDGGLGGHPEMIVPGVEAPTGSLGHGPAIGAGFALAARLSKRDYRTYVVVGDGECGEGSIWETALSAAKNKLDNLVILVDYNKWMSFGRTQEVCNLDPLVDKWRAFGFAAEEVDMTREPERLRDLLQRQPLEAGKPTAVVCHTIKGAGVPWIENNLAWHHKSRIKDEDIQAVINYLEQAHA